MFHIKSPPYLQGCNSSLSWSAFNMKRLHDALSLSDIILTTVLHLEVISLPTVQSQSLSSAYMWSET